MDGDELLESAYASAGRDIIFMTSGFLNIKQHLKWFWVWLHCRALETSAGYSRMTYDGSTEKDDIAEVMLDMISAALEHERSQARYCRGNQTALRATT